VWQRHALAQAKDRPQEDEVLRRRSCECHDLYDLLVPYVDAWQWQKLCVEEKVAMLAGGEDFDDTLIVLQHPPVYTLGTRSSEANLKFDVSDPPFELHRTERGGEVGIDFAFVAMLSLLAHIESPNLLNMLKVL